MNTKNLLGASALLMLGIISLGLLIRSGIITYSEKDRCVSVKGLSEREVMADQVIWPLMYKDVSNDLLELYNSIDERNKTIIKFLNDNGITADEISISSPKVFDREAERWSDSNIVYRYQITSVVTVSSNQVDKVRALIKRQGELLKVGIALGSDYEYQTQYLFNGLNDLKPSMIEEATRNARSVAEKFAADSESSLGEIKTAVQGQFSISDRDENTPYLKKVRVVTTLEYYLK